MANPFGESEATGNSEEIIEGFICPICHEDLRTFEFLTDHFERSHGEDGDALKSIFKDIFFKAKKTIGFKFDDSSELSQSLEKNAKISGNGEYAAGSGSSNSLNNNLSTKSARSRINVFNFMEHQELGAERGYLKYFQSFRNPRLERYASETNKLIIRLHKLLKDMPTESILRKLHEQSIVTWLDGSSVNLCPSCARNFHLARRQHHCRLCGCIMCQDCSQFLAIDVANVLANINPTQNSISNSGKGKKAQQQESIRCCEHCLWLLETRQEMSESRTSNPPIAQLYAILQEKRKEVLPNAEMYQKILKSLYAGESIFTLADASRLRVKIGQIAEAIELQSKGILSLECEEGSRTQALHKAIRLSCVQLIKEKLLSLPPLPAEEEIRSIQERKKLETEQRIETERRMALEAYKRYGLHNSSKSSLNVNGSYVQDNSTSTYVQNSDIQSLENWSAPQVKTTGNLISSNDPLIEQINIIKGYILQARQEMNFDVVETLELNLRDLQHEFYQRQCTTSIVINYFSIIYKIIYYVSFQ